MLLSNPTAAHVFAPDVDDMSQWMKNLPEQATQEPLNRLAIPGSHDSGAYWFNLTLPLSADQPKVLRQLDRFTSTVRRIVRRWSLTQDLTIGEQLLSGTLF